MKRICVWGGGWSGLTAALELSESQECEVHLFESSHEFGGKVLGSVNDEQISTHAIRLISEYYPAFANVCSRVKVNEQQTLLDRWSPVEFFNFYASHQQQHNLISRRIDNGLLASLKLLNSAIFTFGININDVLSIRKVIKQFRQLSENQIEQLEADQISIEAYLSRYPLSLPAREFIFDYLGITVAARPQSTSTMSLDLMSKMFVGVHRCKAINSPQHKPYKSWVIDGPLGDRLLPPFLDELNKRGVKLYTNMALTAFNYDSGKPIAIANEQQQVTADAHILALHNKVIEQLGFGRAHPLQNEWSIGTIVALESLPKELKKINHKSITAVMDSPWAVVFAIWTTKDNGGLWSNEVKLPKGSQYILEITASRLENQGSTGKSFFECTPDEAAAELLKQISIQDEQLITELSPQFVFSNALSYTNSAHPDSSALQGPVQPNGYYWQLNAPIYTSSPETLPLASKTHVDNIFLCGESIKCDYPYIKTPTLELASETAKNAAQKVFSYLSINHHVPQDYPKRFKTRQKI